MSDGAEATRAVLSLTLFGLPQAALDGRLLRFRRRSALALLAYLAVRSRASTRAQLAALLTDNPAYGLALLRNTLLELRAHLGDHLRIDDTFIGLDPALTLQTDVAAFEEALATSGEARTAQLQAAIETCRGEFLEGLTLRGAYAFEEWQQLERERLHTLVMGACEELRDTLWRKGRLDQALGYARRQIAAEPWHEGAHRAVMLLLLQRGQRGEAFAEYALCRQILEAELAAEPAPETEALYRRILAAAPPPHNLPPEPTPLVGRVGELEQVAGWLDGRGSRVVAITGPGGIGKTRLALRAVARYVEAKPGIGWLRFPDGAHLVALDALPPDRNGPAGRSAERIFKAVAGALGLPGPHSPAQVLAALHERTLLLILDNVEHLAGTGPVIAQICAEAPGVTVLATSRGAVPGAQQMLELAPLEVPADAADLERAESSRLFLQAARQARLTFAPDAEREAIARICAAVDGLPLAIVQAAQLVRIMPCAAIAEFLARRPLELSTRLRNLPPRHQSLRANLAYAWDLLAPVEQLAVRRQVERDRGPGPAPLMGADALSALAAVGLLAHSPGGARTIPHLLYALLAGPATITTA